MDLRDFLRYEPETGELFWTVDVSNANKSGDRAGGSIRERYRRVHLKGKNYLEHRVVWFLVHGAWPKGQIDHINGDKQDNRIANLRAVNAFQNMQNRAPHREGKSWGVHFVRGKWHASIGHDGESIHIGVFEFEIEARGAVYGFLKGKGWLEHYGFQ